MFSINFQSRTPVYIQLYENVVRLVTFGALKENDKLPPVRILATELGINPNTVSKAYSMLENDGYIYSSVGRGSFISSKLTNGEAEKLQAKKELKECLNHSLHSGITREEAEGILRQVYDSMGGSMDD